MYTMCSQCGSRSTVNFPSLPGHCTRCNANTMERQVFPWAIKCDDCGHIKTHDSQPEHFHKCGCWCHKHDRGEAYSGKAPQHPSLERLTRALPRPKPPTNERGKGKRRA